MKECKHCRESKDLNSFKDSVNSDDGKHPMCNACLKVLVEEHNKRVEHYRS